MPTALGRETVRHSRRYVRKSLLSGHLAVQQLFCAVVVRRQRQAEVASAVGQQLLRALINQQGQGLVVEL